MAFALFPIFKLLHRLVVRKVLNGRNSILGTFKSSIWDNFEYTGSVRKGCVSPKLLVPASIKTPSYCDSGVPRESYNKPLIKTANDIESMKKSCAIARSVLDTVSTCIRVGTTTDFIDKVAHKIIIENNAYPSPLNYWGFPKSVCTSINEVMCHGIPDNRVLELGDIVNVDVTVFYEGFHGDCSETFLVLENENNSNLDSKNMEQNLKLMKVAHDAMMMGISVCRHGIPIKLIGHKIESFLRNHNCRTFPDLCGHGIGKGFHEPPIVSHTNNDCKDILLEGMTITIEPVVSFSVEDPMSLKHSSSPTAMELNYITWPDLWTTATVDGSRTAQFEHTILITMDGADILTNKTKSSPPYIWNKA